jgi:membrane protease YdiL (CAAX protease family)
VGEAFSKFDEPVPPPSGGFQMRDVLRFFVVDVIVTASLRLLELVGFFRTIDQHVVAILVSKILIFLYLIWLVRERRDAWAETGAATAGKIWAWPLAIGIYAAGYPLLLWFDALNIEWMTRLYALLGAAYEHRPQAVMILTFEDILSPPVRTALILMIVLVGPVLEELAFRGMMMDACRRGRSAAWAVAATGLLFGAYHFSLPFFLPLGALGMLFGLIRVVCGTLWCSILAHCAHNALTLLLMADRLGILRDAYEKWAAWLGNAPV